LRRNPGACQADQLYHDLPVQPPIGTFPSVPIPLDAIGTASS